MHLVLGLGNPGRRYARTRHNVGFLVVDRLGERWSAPCDRSKVGALMATARVGSTPVIFAKPQTYMNRSGGPASSLRSFYKVAVPDIVVVHDDVDLAFGQVRVKRGGGHGGHNGLRDLHQKLGSNGYLRVRFGISRPPSGWDTADYVLGGWSDDESNQVDDLVDRAADAVELILRRGVTEAMNQFNVRPRKKTAQKNDIEVDGPSERAVEEP